MPLGVHALACSGAADTLNRIFRTLPKGTAHGVPALAGQTPFRPASHYKWSRLQRATPCRLKPGLHALHRLKLLRASFASSIRRGLRRLVRGVATVSRRTV